MLFGIEWSPSRSGLNIAPSAEQLDQRDRQPDDAGRHDPQLPKQPRLQAAHAGFYRTDVDCQTTDETEGEVDLTLSSVLPYAHWTPRPGLGV